MPSEALRSMDVEGGLAMATIGWAEAAVLVGILAVFAAIALVLVLAMGSSSGQKRRP